MLFFYKLETMRQSRVAQGCLLLSLIAGAAVTNAAYTGLTVTEDDITFSIDLFEGSVNPYRVSFKLDDVFSAYKFSDTGRIVSLKVGSTRYFFFTGEDQMDEETTESDSPESETGNRMLVSTDEITPAKTVGFHRRLYWLECSDCEAAVETLCSVSLDDVCFVRDNLFEKFTDDGQDSLNAMCDVFGAACEAPPAAICEGFCVEGKTAGCKLSNTTHNIQRIVGVPNAW